MKKNLKVFAKNVFFVLVEPQYPGNVGAVARALKTMGFQNLRLVNPCDYLAPQARWMAHASEDVLENVRTYPDLTMAVKDIHFVIATTQREREFHFPFFTPSELAQKLIPISQDHRVALVFGREQTGLTNEEIGCCHAVTTILAMRKHPSLNLSQAVMIYAYELYKASYEEEKKYTWRLASHKEIEKVYEHLRRSLEAVKFLPQDNWESFIMRFRRFFARANPEVRDVRLMHKILQSFDEHIARLNQQMKHSRRD